MKYFYRILVISFCILFFILSFQNCSGAFNISKISTAPESQSSPNLELETPDLGTTCNCVFVNDFVKKETTGTISQKNTQGLLKAIQVAKPGQSVVFPEGEFLINPSDADTNKLVLLKGLKYLGMGTIIKSMLNSRTMITVVNSERQEETQFSDINFENITLRLSGTDISSFTNVLIEDCNFSETKVTDFTNDVDAALKWVTPQTSYENTFVDLFYVSNAVVRKSSFYRTNDFTGKGIYLYKTQKILISNNIFFGRFITAINGTGSAEINGEFPENQRNFNIQISENKIERTLDPRHTIIQSIEEEDHGIYIWGFKDLKIEDNRISGWSLSEYGGSIKIRNGENLLVKNNVFYNSGVLLYTYDNVVPKYFKNIVIENNNIDLTTSRTIPNSIPEKDRPGILYWRNFGTSTTHAESNIIIRNNRLTESNIKIYDPYQIEELFVSQ